MSLGMMMLGVYDRPAVQAAFVRAGRWLGDDRRLAYRHLQHRLMEETEDGFDANVSFRLRCGR